MSKSSQHTEDNVIESFKDTIPLSLGEEIGNATSHGIAALMTLLLLSYVAVHSYNEHGTLSSISVSIFVISIFMMSTSSTVYRLVESNTSHKYILRVIGYSMIYVAIFGTYTPVLLAAVGGWLGWLVFLSSWGTIIWDILYKSISTRINPKLSLIVYSVMGWVGIMFLSVIIIRISWLPILFIVLGGFPYTIGAWFYVQKNRPYFHMIWHILIAIASPLHFIEIVYFM